MSGSIDESKSGSVLLSAIDPPDKKVLQVDFKTITVTIPSDAVLSQWSTRGTYAGVVETNRAGQLQVRFDWNGPTSTGMAKWTVQRKGNTATDKSPLVEIGSATPVDGNHEVTDMSPSPTGSYLYDFVLVNDSTSPEGNPVQMRITAHSLWVEVQSRSVTDL